MFILISASFYWNLDLTSFTLIFASAAFKQIYLSCIQLIREQLFWNNLTTIVYMWIKCMYLAILRQFFKIALRNRRITISKACIIFTKIEAIQRSVCNCCCLDIMISFPHSFVVHFKMLLLLWLSLLLLCISI